MGLRSDSYPDHAGIVARTRYFMRRRQAVETLEEAGYTKVVELNDGGGGYDWAELHVYTKDNRVFINTQSGCSCSSWEEPGESDLIELATLAGAKTFWEEMMGSYASDDKWLDVRSTFADLGLR